MDPEAEAETPGQRTNRNRPPPRAPPMRYTAFQAKGRSWPPRETRSSGTSE